MTARLVTLHDGATAPSDSEAWRHECEARAIAALPTLAARRAWLAAIAKRRGDPAADRLRATIAAIWAQRTPQERWATTHVAKRAQNAPTGTDRGLAGHGGGSQ